MKIREQRALQYLEASFGYERCFTIADARKAFDTKSADRFVNPKSPSCVSWIERVGPAGSNQYRLKRISADL
jgi:hypothetical protein